MPTDPWPRVPHLSQKTAKEGRENHWVYHIEAAAQAGIPLPLWRDDDGDDDKLLLLVQSATLSCVWLFATPWTAACQAPLSPRVCSNSCPLRQWCYLSISLLLWSLLLLLFSCQVLSDSSRPHELQPARFPCPSPSPGVQVHWVGDAIQPSHPLLQSKNSWRYSLEVSCGMATTRG